MCDITAVWYYCWPGWENSQEREAEEREVVEVMGNLRDRGRAGHRDLTGWLGMAGKMLHAAHSESG